MGLRQRERVDGADAIDLESLDGVSQVISRACRRCEMQNEVDRTVDGEQLHDIPPQESEAAVSFEVSEVAGDPGKKVVDPNDIPALREEVVAKMRAEKSGGSSDRHGCRTRRPLAHIEIVSVHGDHATCR